MNVPDFSADRKKFFTWSWDAKKSYKIDVPPLNNLNWNYACISDQNGYNLSTDTSKVRNELHIRF